MLQDMINARFNWSRLTIGIDLLVQLVVGSATTLCFTVPFDFSITNSGNKIFQYVFIKIISPDSTVMGGWLWNLVNVGAV